MVCCLGQWRSPSLSWAHLQDSVILSQWVCSTSAEHSVTNSATQPAGVCPENCNIYLLIKMKTLTLLFNFLLFNQQVHRGQACLCSLLIAAGKFTVSSLLLQNPPHTILQCPAPPSCCESGQYAYDECGCCLKCARAELQTCGGASDISGKCAGGLQCLKTCSES